MPGCQADRAAEAKGTSPRLVVERKKLPVWRPFGRMATAKPIRSAEQFAAWAEKLAITELLKRKPIDLQPMHVISVIWYTRFVRICVGVGMLGWFANHSRGISAKLASPGKRTKFDRGRVKCVYSSANNAFGVLFKTDTPNSILIFLPINGTGAE